MPQYNQQLLPANLAQLGTALPPYQSGTNFGLAAFNFKPSNTNHLRHQLAVVRSGTSDAPILFVGDSTTAGGGSGTGSGNFSGAYVNSPIIRAAQTTNGRQIAAQSAAMLGGNGAPTPATYDTRLVLGAGWNAVSAGIAGSLYQNTTTTNALAFTPTQVFTTIDIYYATNPTFGTFTVNVDGGATAATQVCTAAAGVALLTVTVASGTHTINIARTAGDVRIEGINIRNSAAPALQILQVGTGGATSATYNNATNAWAPFYSVPFVANGGGMFIDLGINDWLTAVPVATYKANIEALIRAWGVNGAGNDIVLVSPDPTNPSVIPVATQQQYRDALYALAKQYDLPFVDMQVWFTSYAIANGLGEYNDNTHCNAIGYAKKGALLAYALMQLD